MKRWLWVLLLCALSGAGCAELTQVAGELVASQTYEERYQKEYQKARAQGLGDAEARALAEQKARGRADKKQSLFAGIGDVLSSAGEVDEASERAIGESLALAGFGRYGLPLEDAALQEYVNLVGHSVARNSSRPQLPYRFVVLDSPLYNAFACPGGIIFVSAALVRGLQDEAELACVLAHEVGHVTHRHALRSVRRARFFEGVGKITVATMRGGEGELFQSMIGNLQNVLFDKGLDKGMEFEADLTAMEIAYRTGYDPRGMVRVLEMLKEREQEAEKEGSWFSTHPPLDARLERLRERVGEYADAASLARVAERFRTRADAL